MWLWVGLGAALGATMRYALTNYGKKHWMRNKKFPIPTLVINLSGAFLLGLLFALNVNPAIYAFVGTGVMGGYTTFSTMNTELLSLKNNGEKRTFWIYLITSYIGGLALVFVGYVVGKI